MCKQRGRFGERTDDGCGRASGAGRRGRQGLHSKGWTEEQSVNFFLANSPAAEGQVRAEVRRYIVMPGQATGYEIGMIKMEELRRRAEDQLGSKFDIRAFHDTILGRAQMPLDLLDQRVNRWIAEQDAR